MTLNPGSTLYCTCHRRDGGWTNIGLAAEREWWVHHECGRPSQAWLLSQGGAVLNFFRGGPHDGYAWDTDALIASGAALGHLDEYKWTPEVVTSAATGKSARVWMHVSLEHHTDGAEQNSNAAVCKDRKSVV